MENGDAEHTLLLRVLALMRAGNRVWQLSRPG